MKKVLPHVIPHFTYIAIAYFWGWWFMETGITETMRSPFVYVLFFLSLVYGLQQFPIFKKPDNKKKTKVINEKLHRKINSL